MSEVSSEDEFDEFLNTQVPPHIAAIIKIGLEYLGDEIDFSFVHPQLGLRGRITGEGLSLVLRNAAKFIK